MSRASKFLSLVLRHDPSAAGVELDRQGWVRVDDLLRGCRQAGRAISRAELDEIVATSDKRRFTISPCGTRIRAAQGHSVAVDLGLAPVAPPDLLYHGTASGNLDSIFTAGLLPGRRRDVHLSGDVETARAVGRRHGKPVVLVVAAGEMHRDGHVFRRADNGVWLTDRVPPSRLAFA